MKKKKHNNTLTFTKIDLPIDQKSLTAVAAAAVAAAAGFSIVESFLRIWLSRCLFIFAFDSLLFIDRVARLLARSLAVQHESRKSSLV